jgi:quinol-cytochrome oxidoreductase complex cytochrome b subunit
VQRGEYREGPGAATAAPIDISPQEAGHALEPEYKRIPIGPDHILYPVLVGLALFPILMGAAGHHMADDMPDDETHPFFPDHFWPYPIIMAVVILAMAAAAAFLTNSFTLDLPADPRTTPVGGPRPEWYFMFLFQFLKMGPELIMALIFPGVVTVIMLVWPWLDKLFDAMQTQRWKPPAKNAITGLVGLVWFLWMLGLGILGLMEFDPNASWLLLLGATLVLILLVLGFSRGGPRHATLPLGQTATYVPAAPQPAPLNPAASTES